MNKKGKNLETAYFLKEDLEKKYELDKEQKKQKKELKEEQLKKLHFMKCPKCGFNLKTKRLNFIDIDTCEHCGVLVLSKEDVPKFLAEEKSILKSLFDFFK